MTNLKEGDSCQTHTAMISGEVLSHKEGQERWASVSHKDYYYEMTSDPTIYRCECGNLKHRCICKKRTVDRTTMSADERHDDEVAHDNAFWANL